MSNQEELIETGNHDVDMGEALARLDKNPDFIKVIREGYLEGKVLASVSLLSVPQVKDAGKRPEVMEDLVAASNLQYWLQMVERRCQALKDPILSDEEEQELEAAEGGI